MKKLRTFAVSMIIAAIGLLIYCAGLYIKSYEQNLATRQEYAELSQMAVENITLPVLLLIRRWIPGEIGLMVWLMII